MTVSLKKKKIIITIGRATIARNLLQNAFFQELKANYQVVILSPAAKEKIFLETFAGEGVSFVELKEISHSWVDRIFVAFHRYLLFDKFMALKIRYGIRGVSRPEEASFWRYLIYSAVFIPLSKIGWLKKVVRWFDYHCAQRGMVRQLQQFLQQERIDIVFATSVFSNIETALVKAARKNRLPVAGMVKSWDTPSKMNIRIVPDILIVWSQFMVDQFVKLQHISSDRLRVVGVPQFDDYADKSFQWSRDRFCQEYGLDAKRKIILYTSAGKGVPEDATIVSLIIEGMKSGVIEGEVQLLIRPHFKYRNDNAKFKLFARVPFVAIDARGSGESLSSFRDEMNLNREHTERLINTLYHSDMVVNVASTITLDAAVFGKPSVHPMLREAIGNKAPGDSYLMFYESDYVKALQATGANELARSKTELYQAINYCLKNPQARVAERQVMLERFCYRIDGESGRRLVQVLIDFTNQQ